MPRSPNYVTIRVTSSVDYLFDLNHHPGSTPEDIVHDYFENYSLNSSHAARDGSVLGNSRKLVKAIVIRDR